MARLTCDLAVDKPPRHECHHLALAWGELIEDFGVGARGRRPRRKLGDQPAREARREQRSSVCKGVDRTHELGRLGVLEQQTGGPGPQGGEDVLVSVGGGQQQHRHSRLGDYFARDLNAVDPRQPLIEQDDVREGPTSQRGRLLAGGRLADNLDAPIGLEQDSEAGAHQRRTGDQYPGGMRGGDPARAAWPAAIERDKLAASGERSERRGFSRRRDW
jgi:hypothetical protein